MIKEIYYFFIYRKAIINLEKTNVLKENGFWRNGLLYGLTYGVNLKSETLLLLSKPENEISLEEKSELEKLEKSFVGKEISKHNGIFMEKGILELMKTYAERWKTPDYYGYVVYLDFNFKEFSIYVLIWFLIYFSLILKLIFYIYPIIIKLIS